MANYDARIIKGYAQALYDRAQMTIVVHTIVGALIGLAPAAIITRGPGIAISVVAAPLLGGIGYFLGSGKAAAMRLEAQIALCQVQIEENTRRVQASFAEQKDERPVATTVAPSPSPTPAVVAASQLSSGHADADYKCANCGVFFNGGPLSACPECGSSVKTPMR